MNLTVPIKLLPTPSQHASMLVTVFQANHACNHISRKVKDLPVKTKVNIHKEVYYGVRWLYGLPSQTVIRCIGKVTDAYKLKPTKPPRFRPTGSVAFDTRNLKILKNHVKITTTHGRYRIPYRCNKDQHHRILTHKIGESDLVLRDGRFYLHLTLHVPYVTPIPSPTTNIIGVDLGIRNIAVMSTGRVYAGTKLNRLRKRYQRIRSRLQSKGTRSSRRLLRKRRRKEQRMVRDVNHWISKSIVREAKRTHSTIALEELKGIRRGRSGTKGSGRVTKLQRRTLHGWSFHQLISFILYKSLFHGVRVVFVNPAYTSQMCPKCGHVDKKNRPTRDLFQCCRCGYADHADDVAAMNIRSRAAVDVVGNNHPSTHRTPGVVLPSP